ncbi:MAG: hypothetical protein ACKVOR_08670 [Flavobacteriales bacterium]
MTKKSSILIAVAFVLLIVISSCGRRKESCAAYDRVQVQQAK